MAAGRLAGTGWDAGWTDGDGESVSVTSARLRGLSVVMVMGCGKDPTEDEARWNKYKSLKLIYSYDTSS